MAGPTIDTQAGSALKGVASDAHSLDQLRQLANQDPAKAVKAVATQFEALFMQMVLKSMREATPKSGMFDSEDQQTYTAMLDQQLAQKIAAGGTGLGAVIARQLSANLPHALGAAPGATPAGTAAAGGVHAPAPAAAGTAAAPVLPAAAAPAPGAGSASASGAVLLRTIRAAAAVRGAR